MILRATLLSILLLCGLGSVGLTTWYRSRYDAPPSAPRFDISKSEAGLDPLLEAMEVMEDHFFSLSTGSWEDAIDWTAAVMGTHISTALTTVTAARNHSDTAKQLSLTLEVENTINRYFSQLVQFYFGQNSLSLRLQAFDDMLWVVLEWLETIKLVSLHSKLHWNSSPDGKNRTWYGHQFQAAFAHRARVFYDLASKGWDTSLCGGGMIWSPYLRPYKNAITNQLFITASVGMYLDFPGDDNDSPFVANDGLFPGMPTIKPHDPRFLKSAIDAYAWLASSNMTNEHGLYVDGYHITDEDSDDPVCDERNEMVYTYNQGVVLSGLRGLWESTDKDAYLKDGYKLIENVINATNWHNQSLWSVREEAGDDSRPRLGRWGGLGRDGLLEEICDASGSCSQNGQTFKGIFFWHLSTFCHPLPSEARFPKITYEASPALSKEHEDKCRGYTSWVEHNARAVNATKSSEGEFGMWWSKISRRLLRRSVMADSPLPDRAIDYRNLGIPETALWRDAESNHSFSLTFKNRTLLSKWDASRRRDLNDRGRGRTVETQGTGLAVLKAYWDLVHFRKGREGGDKRDL